MKDSIKSVIEDLEKLQKSANEKLKQLRAEEKHKINRKNKLYINSECTDTSESRKLSAEIFEIRNTIKKHEEMLISFDGPGISKTTLREINKYINPNMVPDSIIEFGRWCGGVSSQSESVLRAFGGGLVTLYTDSYYNFDNEDEEEYLDLPEFFRNVILLGEYSGYEKGLIGAWAQPKGTKDTEVIFINLEERHIYRISNSYVNFMRRGVECLKLEQEQDYFQPTADAQALIASVDGDNVLPNRKKGVSRFFFDNSDCWPEEWKTAVGEFLDSYNASKNSAIEILAKMNVDDPTYWAKRAIHDPDQPIIQALMVNMILLDLIPTNADESWHDELTVCAKENCNENFISYLNTKGITSNDISVFSNLVAKAYLDRIIGAIDCSFARSSLSVTAVTNDIEWKLFEVNANSKPKRGIDLSGFYSELKEKGWITRIK